MTAAPLRYILLGSFAVAVALRVPLFFEITAVPTIELLQVDARAHQDRGVAIAAGAGLGSRIYYEVPLYDYALGALYRLFGPSHPAAVAVQMLLGILTVVLLTWLTYRLAGGLAASVTGMLATLYRPFLFYEIVLLKTTLATVAFTATLALVLPSRPGPARLVLAGLLMGIALLCQSQLGIGLLFLLVWAHRFEPWRGPVAVAAGLLLVLLPFTIRNRVVAGEWVLATSQVGQNLYTGNGPHVVDGRFQTPPFVRANPMFEEADFRRRAETEAGRPLTSAEVSRHWLRRTFSYAQSEPWRCARNLGHKILESMQSYEPPDNFNLELERRRFAVLDLPLVTFGVVASLGLAGALLGLADGDPRVRRVALLGPAYLLGVAVFFVFARYRVPIVPVLILCGSVALARFADACRRGQTRLILRFVLAFTAAAALVYSPTDPVSLAPAYVNLARVHLEDAFLAHKAMDQHRAERGLERARHYLDQARAEAPTWAEPERLLARALGTSGDLEQAERALRRALRKEPGHPAALRELRQVLIARGDHEGAARLGEDGGSTERPQAAKAPAAR